MNRLPRLILLAGLLGAVTDLRAQIPEAVAGETDERVQYQLVLPDEKTPENVKPEERNPFESESEAQSRLSPGDTEENRVRDKLLKLPVVGVKRMTDGRMRVLLGNIILETGGSVPPVLPEQLVELKVKNITPQYIELAWQEKRTTGLPPKLMTIPINLSPKIRYQMLGQVEELGKNSGGVNATMDLPLRDNTAATAVTTAPPPPRAGFVDESPVLPEPVRQTAMKESATPPPAQAPAPEKPASTPPSRSPAVDSVVRMLFGTPASAPR